MWQGPNQTFVKWVGARAVVVMVMMFGLTDKIGITAVKLTGRIDEISTYKARNYYTN